MGDNESNRELDPVQIAEDAAMNTIKDLIETIDKEFSVSEDWQYITKEGTNIPTDVECCREWFSDYEEVLKKRYNM